MYRVEDKFGCSREELFRLQGRLQYLLDCDSNESDEQGYKISSLYFDDLQDSCLKDTIEGHQSRRKYRIRIYNDSLDLIKLEVKEKHNNRIYKLSKPITKEEADKLIRGECIACTYRDYDGAFGEYLHTSENHVNPAQSVLDGEPTELTWYQKLYDNPVFLDAVIKKYQEAMPALKKLYTETIDLYADYIATSVRNDDIRWNGYNETLPRTGNYQSWENDVRYLKYFCITRYNALKERWGIQGDALSFETTGKTHQVKVLYGGAEALINVQDGDTLKPEQLSALIPTDHCVIEIGYSEEPYSQYMPVFEDYTLKAEAKPVITTADDCKLIDIPQNIFTQHYDYVSVFNIYSDGNTEVLQVAQPLTDIHLQLEKDQTGLIAIYVFADEECATVLEEVMIEY